MKQFCLTSNVFQCMSFSCLRNSMCLSFTFQTSSITSASSLDEDEAQTVIQHLQEELIALRLKDADIDILVKELRTKIKELEEVMKKRKKMILYTVYIFLPPSSFGEFKNGQIFSGFKAEYLAF